MRNGFLLEIITPEKVFFSGTVEEMIINTSSGELEIMHHTLPMVANVAPGLICITQNGRKMEAACSEGFMRVGNESTSVLVKGCKWPYEINEEEAGMEIKLLNQKIKEVDSVKEYKSLKVKLAMMIAQLKAKHKDN